MVILTAWRALTERRRVHPQQFDLPGAALLAIGLGAVTLALSFGQEWGWISPRLLVCVSALAAAAFVERRGSRTHPEPDAAAQPRLVLANVSFVMTMLALFAVGFLMLFYFEELRGFSTLYSGLLLTPLALTIAALAPLSGTVADRLNSRWQAPLGLAVACTGRLHLSTLDQSSTISYVVMCLVVAGTGQALFTSPNAKTVMDAATPAEQGIASGIHATGRNVGQGLSVAMAAVFSSWGGAVAGRAWAGRRCRSNR
jgi:predicted MFS family arabinose efflux permease